MALTDNSNASLTCFWIDMAEPRSVPSVDTGTKYTEEIVANVDKFGSSPVKDVFHIWQQTEVMI